MAFRLRRGRPTQQAASEPPAEGGVHPAPVVYTGETILPEEGASERISSAADVDVNIKRYGVVTGGPGGAGGFGGAGTK